MVVLTPETVNQTYARHIDWYPKIQNPGLPPQVISGLHEILEEFELILLDSYGVLCRGTTPIEGAQEAISLMRSQNKTFRVVSNDTLTNQSLSVEKYQKRGFEFSANEVITSLDITETFLATVTEPETYGIIAPENHPSQSLLEGMVRLNEFNGKIPEQVTTLLFLTGSGWTSKMQDHLVSSANGRQFKLLVGNPDIGAPYEDKIAATPGYFLADFFLRTQQTRTPTLLGKPDLAIFTRSHQSAGLPDPNKVLMVGDTLYTDILGGNAMGFKTLLLQSGIYHEMDIHEQIRISGISPDYIAPHL